MIQLTAEEYEALKRDAERYRGLRRIVTGPDAMPTAAFNVCADKFGPDFIERVSGNPDLYDQVTDMGIEMVNALWGQPE